MPNSDKMKSASKSVKLSDHASLPARTSAIIQYCPEPIRGYCLITPETNRIQVIKYGK